MVNLKYNNFQESTEHPIYIRKECLNNKHVIFAFPRDLASYIQDSINFDIESELILEKIKNTNRNRFFEYDHGGFLEVNNPTWFIC